MKYSDITKKTDKELEKLLEETRNKLQDLRQSLRVSGKTKPHEITVSRKTVARIMTELNSRKLKPVRPIRQTQGHPEQVEGRQAQDKEKENA